MSYVFTFLAGCCFWEGLVNQVQGRTRRMVQNVVISAVNILMAWWLA